MKISVFFAYQFVTAEIAQIDRESFIAKCCDKVQKDLQRKQRFFKIIWEQFDLKSGSFLKGEIEERISRADVFIADISEANANVMYEVGWAESLSRRKALTIGLMKSCSSPEKVPSDLSGVVLEYYDVSYYEYALAKLIKSCCLEYIERASDEWTRATFWNFRGNEELDLICSEIPKELLPDYAFPKDLDYVRYAKFADLDSLMHLRTALARCFPSIRTREFTASEHSGGANNDIFVIGGPAWNPKSRALQNLLPFSFIDRAEEKTDILVVNPDLDIEMREYRPIIYSHGDGLKDIAAVTRLTVPSGGRKFLFQGATTKGVVGACRLLFDRRAGIMNCDFVESHVGNSDFSVVFWVEYVHHDIEVPLFGMEEPLLLFARDAGSRWRVLNLGGT